MPASRSSTGRWCEASPGSRRQRGSRPSCRIILPLTLPGIVGGSIIVFIPALGNFIVPDVLGGAKVLMIGNLIEQQFLSARNWPFGSALAMMIMATMLVFLMIYVLASPRAAADAAAGAAEERRA